MKDKYTLDDFITDFFKKSTKSTYHLNDIQDILYAEYLKLNKDEIDFRVVMHKIHDDSIVLDDGLLGAMQRGIISTWDNMIHINAPFNKN